MAKYIYGNQARNLDPIRTPEVPIRRPKVKPKRVSRKTKENRHKHGQINLPYVVALSLATCAFGICSLQLVHVKSSLIYQINQIEGMEKELSQLKIENDFNAAGLDNYLDLEQIEKIAREELQMVPANAEQIIFYQNLESEYVRQHEPIPSE
ncbi:hypothetical protein FACS189418_2290 [Clostridia bacterium]|nr:hypothetical protein FACS189418_2290 [Clostridia bacterium]